MTLESLDTYVSRLGRIAREPRGGGGNHPDFWLPEWNEVDYEDVFRNGRSIRTESVGDTV